MLIVLLVVAVFTVIAFYLKRRYSFWDDWNIPIGGSFPLGILRGVGTKYHISEVITRYYNEMRGKAPIGGLFMFINPFGMIMDLELVKCVLIKDFQYFQNRGVYYNERDDPLSAHLFAIEGNKWRNLRAKLTPTFTSGKMKMMCPIILNVGEQFRELLEHSVNDNAEIEMGEIVARFTTDVIGTCAFGLECNSLKDPEAEFRQMGKKVFQNSPNGLVKILFMATFPEFSRSMGMKAVDADLSVFFMNAVAQTIEYRETNKVVRNDFMDLLINLKNTGHVDGKVAEGAELLTLNEIAAQAFVFFIAGFETSSTAMSYALYEMSLNLEVQEKARQCVRSVLKRHNGVFTYEAMMEMGYLDQCINESLRKYPPVANVTRQVARDYTVPGTNNVLKKGMMVVVPIYAIQHDPEYYPNPDVYDPDRFSPEQTNKRNPLTFLPFGEGPRVCIGLRFGMMQARIGLAIMLNHFKFTKCSKSVIPLVFAKNTPILSPATGLWLNVEKLND